MRNSNAIALAAFFAVSCASSAKTTTEETPAEPKAAETKPAQPVEAQKPAAEDPNSVDARRKKLDALLAEHWEWAMQTYPEFASILGDMRFNDRWTDQSPAAIAANQEKQRAFLAKFEAVDTAGFPDQEILNQQLMVRSLRQELEGVRFQEWLMPIDQMGGFHIQAPQFVSLLRFNSVKDYEDYLKRLRALPAVFDQATALMRDGMSKSLLPPRFLLEVTVGQAAGLAKGKVEDSPFSQPVKKFAETIPAAEQDRLRKEVLDAVRDQVFPAYEKLAVFLKKEYAPRGRKEVGVWSLPDGEARYAYAIKSQTTTAMTADEIHQIGLKEVARIEAEQEAIGKKLGFKNLAAFRKHIRENKKLYATSRQDLLDRYQKHTDLMYEQLPKLFGRLPQLKMIILPVEEFREKDASGAQYTPGIKDGSRPGTVRVNTGDATKRTVIDVESTAYHEGVPGHHLQIAIQQELPELPPYRQHGNYTVFAEGWALYSERLGKEVGFFQDPYSDYGRLDAEILRAIRLVVDTGLHSKKWTRAQVVKYFHDHSSNDEPSIESETNRYIVWPGQALGYKIGELTITRLREKSKAALGEAFDIRAFHDEILGAGALPLDVLEARIDAWIARTKNAKK